MTADICGERGVLFFLGYRKIAISEKLNQFFSEMIAHYLVM